jgi:glycosyltransferase involved in cell wall biosynthesis
MRLSIITINKNNAAGLEKTIQSVVAQTFDDFEYIVIDGNSNDGSVEIIKKYADNLDYWVSENDSGVYNAMNKGIREARGDYCLFLNSGDILISPRTLQNVFEEIDGSVDIYYSDCKNNDNSYDKNPDHLDITTLIAKNINHQNSLIRRSLFIKHGFYNENLRYVSDWEFWLKELWLYKTQFMHIKTNISVYDLHGISSTDSIGREFEKETVCKKIFNEFSELVLELKKYQQSVYGDIIINWGNTKFLDFSLRVYRFLIKRFSKIN